MKNTLMSALLTPGVLATATLLAALGSAPVVAQTTTEVYTCTDAQGRKLRSDRPIPACRDREQIVLNPSGSIKARIGPTLSAKERAALEAQKKAEEAELALAEEEKRRDRLLLARYPNLQAHQKVRAEALAQVLQVKEMALRRIKDLQVQKNKLTEEMAFYQKDPAKAPQKLKNQIKDVDAGLAAQARFMADKDAEIDRTNARFDTEQARLEPMWQAASAPVR